MNGRQAIALLLSPVATLSLIWIVAVLDEGRSWPAVVRRAREHPGIAGRGGVPLVALGVVAGIPAALGLLPGGAVLLLGSLVACMIGRRLIGGKGGRADVGWFAVTAWCVAAGFLRFETIEPQEALAAQAVLGPGPISGTIFAAGVSWLALVSGIASSTFWARSLPSSDQAGETGKMLRWGESALAASVVSAAIWGPSLGALVYAPAGAWPWVVTSLAMTVAAVSASVVFSRLLDRLGESRSSMVASVLPAAALVALLLAGAGS